jgi:Fe-S-cluster containining protein
LLHPAQGFCRAYQARPMACRIYLSSDVKSCKVDLENPEDDSIFPQLFDMPLRAGRMMNEGFHARLRRDRKDSLQAFENPIEEGLLKALDDKAFDQWLAGKNVFRKME